MTFMSDYNELYAATLRLAKKLNRPLSEVPNPFRLNELEKYATQLREDERELAKLAEREAEEMVNEGGHEVDELASEIASVFAASEKGVTEPPNAHQKIK